MGLRRLLMVGVCLVGVTSVLGIASAHARPHHASVSDDGDERMTSIPDSMPYGSAPVGVPVSSNTDADAAYEGGGAVSPAMVRAPSVAPRGGLSLSSANTSGVAATTVVNASPVPASSRGLLIAPPGASIPSAVHPIGDTEASAPQNAGSGLIAPPDSTAPVTSRTQHVGKYARHRHAVPSASDAPAPESPAVVVSASISSDTPTTWHVPVHTSLHQIVQSWCDRVGWQLTWKTDYDYVTAAGADLHDMTFEDALTVVIGAYEKASPPLVLDTYSDNRAVFISSPSSTDVN